MGALTPKQEAFAQAVASGMNQSDAYRDAYAAGKMKLTSINVNASKLVANTKVALRIAELRKPVVEAAQITLTSHLERLKVLSAAAEAGNQYSAAISAEVARGKASGLYVEKTELTGAGGLPLSIAVTFE